MAKPPKRSSPLTPSSTTTPRVNGCAPPRCIVRMSSIERRLDAEELRWIGEGRGMAAE